ncbi:MULTISPECIES: AfsR/SARP family transcriptional regulator [unclassified Streptomyces]|uniref:AfsR/SARP family transcriptional regulator n=1 Tax=unclassified Streptomyces TaxID=2593676 RepID=UPI00081BA80F|nr:MULTISPECIES: AfsR/SARP family transcriptional regulator [unclassified Streptomyces]MYQ83374.1 AfsR family transcriptional regulator [Streptomyces sp. SID4936]SCD65224.1 DNA-binding transcriptional activator of the SARP family [Streptomyces sp. DvalAA-43]
MDFRLLGRVGAATGAEELQLGPVKRRSVLAALLLKANSAVPVDQLIDALWDDAPPTHARTVVQGHVSRLRALLASAGAGEHGVGLMTQGPSYVFEVPETLLDTCRFDRLARRGRLRQRPADAVAVLGEALALWHGPALDGTAPSAPLRAAAQTLEEARLDVVESLAVAYERLGDRAGAVAVLQAEVAAHPLRESLAEALILALYRAGRRSDALDRYHRVRCLLADELGVGPGPGLRSAYETALRGGPVGAGGAGPVDLLPAPGAGPAPVPGTGLAPVPDARYGADALLLAPAGRPPAPAGPAPRLLPRGVRGFLGRDTELAALDRIAGAGDGAVALVTGPAGVGKTALALQWAHHRQARYPGGTLFADLRGFGGVPAEPAETVREFLIALGVPARDLPDSAAAAAALYRELTARRALLVVLDNVRGTDQVRSLLPSGTGSAVLVTSRIRLSGLIVEELARPVPLDVLGPVPATELLAAAVGEERVAAEPEAADRLARLCDGLPLALRITAAQLAARPRWRLADLAAELADEQRRLALLSLDEAEESGVAAALRITVQGLPPEAVRLFALLGVVPGPDLERYAAAALLGRDPAVAAEALDRLAGAHLVTEYAPGRYSMHDLVRLYARGLGTDEGALLRLLDSYTATALAASLAAEPGEKPCCTLPREAPADAPARTFADRPAALRWYAVERENLAAAVTAARAAGHDDRAWRLAVLQWPYVVWSVRDGWAPLLEQALEASRLLDDPDAESRVRALLGWVLTREGQLSEALAQLELAPALAARAHAPSSEAIALVNLAVALDADGITDTSLRHVTRAVRLAREAQDVLTELLALQHRTRQLLARGDIAAAERCTAYALALDDHGVTTGLGALRRAALRLSRSEALLALGERDAAESCTRQALAEAASQGFQEGVNRARSQLEALGRPVDLPAAPEGGGRPVRS